MSEFQLKIIRAIRIPVLFVALLAVIFLIESEGFLELNRVCGIRPREWKGLLGILTSPLMHGSWEHLFNNSLPLIVLGTALFFFYPTLSLRTIPLIWLGSGVMVWLTARSGTNHIGASGLVYALVTFLFFSGVLRRYGPLIAISMLVVFLYGSLVWGVLPIKEEVSWEGHLWGALLGLGVAYYFRPFGPQRPEYEWEKEGYIEEEDGPWNPNFKGETQLHPKAKPLRIRYVFKAKTEVRAPSDVRPSPPEHPETKKDKEDPDGLIDS